MIIGILCDRKMVGPHASHCVGEKYIDAVTRQLQATVILLPSLAQPQGLDPILDLLDGVLLPGSYSNVAPHRYARQPDFQFELDKARDEWAISIINAAFTRGVPLLGICRGMQEINVAFGGTLHQQVQNVSELTDHREDKSLSLAQQYQHSHSITLATNGWLSGGGEYQKVKVNSLHQQGIDELGNGLRSEARSDDGLVEAISADSATFLLGVQWHPEWQPQNDPFYSHIFSLFGAACRQYQTLKQESI